MSPLRTHRSNSHELQPPSLTGMEAGAERLRAAELQPYESTDITRCRASRSSGGFTLMELLVSMSLMGLVAVAMLFGFRVGTNAWAKGAAGLDHLRQTQATFDLLSRQIGSMKAYYSKQRLKETSAELLLFHGTAAGMRFVSSFSLKSRSAGGLWLVEYFAMKSNSSEQMTLVLNETPLPQDEMLAQSVFREVEFGEDNKPVVRFPEFQARSDSLRLVENASQIQFQYFLPLNQQRQPVAQITATGKEQLPQGVKILLRLQDPRQASIDDVSVVVPIHASVRQQ